MSSAQLSVPQSSDIVSPDVEWYAWSNDGWESAGEGSVRDASKTTRGQAAAFFARESAYGDIRGVRVWKRYVLPFTRQDVWEGPGRDRWVDKQDWDHFHATGDHLPLGPLFEQAPTEPPADWQPDEYDPVWMFVHRSHPGAIPVWICGVKGDEPPTDPKRANVDAA